MNRRFDLGRAVAMTWIVATLGLTVGLAPRMGYRGWLWLGVNGVLCVWGAGWELWTKERRKA